MRTLSNAVVCTGISLSCMDTRDGEAVLCIGDATRQVGMQLRVYIEGVPAYQIERAVEAFNEALAAPVLAQAAE